MPTHWKRDLETDGKKFRDWLARTIPNATGVEITPLTSPTTSGFSNETLLCEASWREGAVQRNESLVVRVQPTGYQVFPEYDMGLQFKTMQLLGETDVPVPRALWLEASGLSPSVLLPVASATMLPTVGKLLIGVLVDGFGVTVATGWDVTVPLHQGLGKTIDYFRGVVAATADA